MTLRNQSKVRPLWKKGHNIWEISQLTGIQELEILFFYPYTVNQLIEGYKMKTKQPTMKAVFTGEMSNGVNYGNKMETICGYKLVDKKTEIDVVDCRVYTGRSRDASQVKATIWIILSDAKKPANWEYHHTSGTGVAGGWGYCKTSSAVASAISDAGIELYGTPYKRHDEKVDFKKRAYIDGVGTQAVETALLAIAHAAGFNDCVLVEY